MQHPLETTVATKTKEPTKSVTVKYKDPLPDGMEEFKGFCMRCRVSITNIRGRYETTENGRGLMRGKHAKCGTGVVKFTQVRKASSKKKKQQVEDDED
jgi:hypothetical protein